MANINYIISTILLNIVLGFKSLIDMFLFVLLCTLSDKEALHGTGSEPKKAKSVCIFHGSLQSHCSKLLIYLIEIADIQSICLYPPLKNTRINTTPHTLFVFLFLRDFTSSLDKFVFSLKWGARGVEC
jgi:hypothetical protein